MDNTFDKYIDAIKNYKEILNLLIDNQLLQQKINNLQDDYLILETKIIRLEIENIELENENFNLEKENYDLQNLIEITP
jgi:predicted  nucleic acid-binding Zn-ribbon protein